MLQAQGESPSSFIRLQFVSSPVKPKLFDLCVHQQIKYFKSLPIYDYIHCAGVEVPSKDSMPKKKPFYGDKRKKKPNAATPEGTALLLLVNYPLIT